ncbi:MAG: hypothetical protein R2939_07090 [Kofleriaceae bacterium]
MRGLLLHRDVTRRQLCSLPLLGAALAGCMVGDVAEWGAYDDGPAVAVALALRDDAGRAVTETTAEDLGKTFTFEVSAVPADGVDHVQVFDHELWLGDAQPDPSAPGRFRLPLAIDEGFARDRVFSALPVRDGHIAVTDGAPLTVASTVRLSTSAAREPLRQAAALQAYVLDVRAGAQAYSAAELFARTSNTRFYLPTANRDNFQPAALTSLRHVMPTTLATLELTYAVLDTIPEVTDCDRVALLGVVRRLLVTLDETKEYARKRPSGNIRIRQAISAHAGAALLRARGGLTCARPSYPSCADCVAFADRIQGGDAGSQLALEKLFSPTYNGAAVDLHADGSSQEGFGYADFWLDAFIPGAIVLARYAGMNPLWQDFRSGLGSAASLRRMIRWREAGLRFDGTWTAVNDSTGSLGFHWAHATYGLLTGIPAGTPAAEVAEFEDLARALRRMSCLARGTVGSHFPRAYEAARYLFGAKFTQFTHRPCADQAAVARATFPQGGHAFVKNVGAQTMLSMFNEGSFTVTDLATARAGWTGIRQEAAAPYADADAGNDFFQTSFAAYPMAFFDWAGEPSVDWRHADGLRPLRDFSYFDSFLTAGGGMTSGCVGPGVCGPVAIKYAGHNRADDTHVELAAFGKTLLFGGGFADYYERDSPIHELRSPVAYNVPMIDGRYPLADALGAAKVVELDSKYGYTLYKMPTGAHDRFVLSVGERWFVIFDRTRSATSEITQEQLHLRGTRSSRSYTSSQGLGYTQLTYSYDEQLVGGGAKPGSRDDTIRLHVFPGLPTADQTLGGEVHVDSCDDVWYLPGLGTRTLADYCQHTSLVAEPLPARTVTGYPFVLWPEKTDGGGDLAQAPRLDWVLETRSGVIETYVMTIRYVRADGRIARMTFRLPAKPSVPITGLASLGVR